MPLYVGLDVGTTTLSTVILDAQTGVLRAHHTVAHDAEVVIVPIAVPASWPAQVTRNTHGAVP